MAAGVLVGELAYAGSVTAALGDAGVGVFELGGLAVVGVVLEGAMVTAGVLSVAVFEGIVLACGPGGGEPAGGREGCARKLINALCEGTWLVRTWY